MIRLIGLSIAAGAVLGAGVLGIAYIALHGYGVL